jgi:hypothetical protein
MNDEKLKVVTEALRQLLAVIKAHECYTVNCDSNKPYAPEFCDCLEHAAEKARKIIDKV